MRFAKLIVGAACAALCGCATMRPYHAKLPDLSGTCASSWAQLQLITPFMATKSQPEALPQEFAKHAQCLGAPVLPTRSTVELYDLRRLGQPAQLEVSLPIAAGGTLAGAVELLDSDFHVLQRRGFDAFTRRGDAYTLTVFLRDGIPHYLALMPDQAFVGKQVASIGSQGSVVPVSAGYVTFMLARGHETKVSIPLMAGGQVGVTVVVSSHNVSAAEASAP